MLAYRLIMTALVSLALLPAMAGGRLAAEQAGAPLWATVVLSILVPAGALVIGLALAQKYGGRKS